MEQVRSKREEAPEEDSVGDYFVVSGPNLTAFVSTAMARHIEACLDRDPCPEWVTFVDCAGSRIRVRSREIAQVCQCTAEQRTRDRAFYRALDIEKQQDRWD